jgi:hypothetical protein
VKYSPTRRDARLDGRSAERRQSGSLHQPAGERQAIISDEATQLSLFGSNQQRATVLKTVTVELFVDGRRTLIDEENHLVRLLEISAREGI